MYFSRKPTQDRDYDDVAAPEQEDDNDNDPSLLTGGKQGRGVKKVPPQRYIGHDHAFIFFFSSLFER